jgi:signal transduction histidine kinase
MATDEFSQTSLDIINNHIQRITEIVRQMSTFARPDPTNVKLSQVNDIVKSSLDLMRLDKRMKSTIEIVQSLDPGLPKIMVDEGQISQVFINIILNALDAMPDGGTLSVTTRRGASDEGTASVIIQFADTGIGIPPGNLEKIFDPFYTTKDPGKGTGLGLALSYNIIKKFGGDIQVDSRENAGSTFTILLPEER